MSEEFWQDLVESSSLIGAAPLAALFAAHALRLL